MPPRKRRPGRRETKVLAAASALDDGGRAQPLVSKLWGFQCRFDASEDLQRAALGARRATECVELSAMRQEEALSQDLRRRELKSDYYILVKLVHRYGACPGDIYCSTTTPGEAYSNYLNSKSSVLACWWRKQRRRQSATERVK